MENLYSLKYDKCEEENLSFTEKFQYGFKVLIFKLNF